MIFANPVAGRGVGFAIADRLKRKLRSEGYCVHEFLQRPEDIPVGDLADPARAAIVIGGDGTLRAVAQQLVRAGNVPPMLPVPMGTANLMGQYLGLRWDSEAIEAQINAAVGHLQVRELDAGVCNGRLFLLMTGVGFDAQVVHELDRVRRGPIRPWSYLLPSLRSLWRYAAAPLRLTLDDRVIESDGGTLAFVANLAEYGTGFPVLPFARPDDRLLDVCLLPCRSRGDLMRLFLLAAAGEHIREEGVIYARAKRIRIESSVAVPVQVDGDPGGHTPVEIGLLPVRLPFVVPSK